MTDTAPALRAQLESGATHDDPSEDLLLMLLEDLEHGVSQWLIVELLEDTSRQTYAQALRLDDGRYLVELREGSADHHYGTRVSDVRQAHELLTGFAFDVDGWRQLAAWERVDL